MSNCIFCKIINKEIPANIIYEDDQVVAFLDISQATKGHTLIVPKTHATDVFEMTEESMASVFCVVPKLAQALKTTFNANGMNILNNNGPVAGQIMFHYHVHLIPRYDETDGFNVISASNGNNYTPEMLADMKNEILKQM